MQYVAGKCNIGKSNRLKRLVLGTAFIFSAFAIYYIVESNGLDKTFLLMLFPVFSIGFLCVLEAKGSFCVMNGLNGTYNLDKGEVEINSFSDLFMDLIDIIILGLVQGITEWIPISSKTQDTLVYLSFLHGNPDFVIPILLFLHIGTVVAAAVYFRKEIIGLISEFLKNPKDLKAHAGSKLGFLFTALMFTGIVGIPLLLIEKKFLPDLNASLLFVVMGLGLLLTGVLLLLQKGSNARQKENANWKDGILTGLLQGLSVLPGVSRSGTSATGLIWRGFDSESSFYLSFLLSIPTVILAELLLYLGGNLSAFPIADGLMLAVSSFIFGYLTLGALLKVVRNINLAYVAFALGLIVIAAGLIGAS